MSEVKRDRLIALLKQHINCEPWSNVGCDLVGIEDAADAILAAQSAAPAPHPLGPCTQAELDAFEGLDSKSKILFSMWVERALKAEAAIDAAPAPSAAQWQPISTAPRDGTRILACGGGLDTTEVVSFNVEVGCWNTPGDTLDDMDDEPEGYNRPTHWMPLPAHPGEQKPPSQTYATFGSEEAKG